MASQRPLLVLVFCCSTVHAVEVALAGAGNTCSDGYSKITSFHACVAALDVLGPGGAEDGTNPPAMPASDFEGVEDDSEWPSGCYLCDDGCDGVWFNAHATGATNGGAAPICARDLEPLATGQVLFMGDSDVDYWATARGLSTGSHNMGVAGFTCVDVLDEVDEMLQTFAPTVLVLVCGENDIQGENATAQVAFSSFSDIVTRVTATGARVVAMSTKNEPSTSEYWASHAAYDALIMDLARSLNGPLTVVDVNFGFQALGNPISLFASDELHLSTEGYSHWDAWAALALEDATCLVWQDGECTETGGTPSDGPSDGVTPSPPPTVSFTATLSSATFDHTNSDHTEGFNAGVAATMQGVSAADVSTAFTQQRRLSAGARRLPGDYEAAITVTVPAGVDHEDVATAVSDDSFTSTLATSLNTELGITDVAVSAVTTPVTVTPASASDSALPSTSATIKVDAAPAATSAFIVVGAMALVWSEM